MRRLLLMRHGKSDWNAAYGGDHERPLARRGRTAAEAMGTVLRRMGETPDLIVSSTAIRARTTAEIARTTARWRCPIELDRRLYGTSPRDALRVAGNCGADSDRLMLVGHEPTWSALVTTLTGGRVPVRTATVVAVDLEAARWEDAVTSRGTVAYVIHPRLFTDGTWQL